MNNLTWLHAKTLQGGGINETLVPRLAKGDSVNFARLGFICPDYCQGVPIPTAKCTFCYVQLCTWQPPHFIRIVCALNYPDACITPVRQVNVKATEGMSGLMSVSVSGLHPMRTNSPARGLVKAYAEILEDQWPENLRISARYPVQEAKVLSGVSGPFVPNFGTLQPSSKIVGHCLQAGQAGLELDIRLS